MGVPGLTETWHAMVSWYTKEAYHFLKRKDKEWIGRKGDVGRGTARGGRREGECDQAGKIK